MVDVVAAIGRTEMLLLMVVGRCTEMLLLMVVGRWAEELKWLAASLGL